ncbi:MAG TPA: AAA family ATPase [Lutibacter sp.]
MNQNSYCKPENGFNLMSEGIDIPSDAEAITPDDNVEKVVYNAVELMALGDLQPKYLMFPIFPQKGTAFLAGKPDTGKSQLARQLCIQVALGEKTFLGFELYPIHKRAIYLTTEDDKEATKYLASKQFEGLGKKEVENLRFIFGDIMEQSEIINELSKQLKLCPVDLVVVDSFGDIFQGNDSNNNMLMRNTVKLFDKIAKKFNCLVLFVHHINKKAYQLTPGQEHIQGGSGLTQKTRLAIQLTEGVGNIRYFTVVKGNYCPKEYKQNSIELIFSEETFLFVNTGNMIPTSEIGTQPDNFRKKTKNNELEATAQAIISDVPVSYGDFITQFCEITSKSEPTAKRAIRNLVKSGFIEKHQGNYCLKGKEMESGKVADDDITS